MMTLILNKSRFYSYIYLFYIFLEAVRSIELTFELEDNKEECYLERIPKDTEVILEYEVSCPFFFFVLYHEQMIVR